VLDALSSGSFFVSTGEVLIPKFSVAGKESGETIRQGSASNFVTLNANIEWTYPLSYMEIISGDGSSIYRERIDLSDTREFGERSLEHSLDLSNRKWVRIEVWDITRNGAFTQPVWIE
jgi:hypothetical protein